MEEQTPNGFDAPPVKRKGGRPKKVRPESPAASPSMSNEQLLTMMGTLVEQMKKPSVLEQKKLDEEAAQQQKLRKMKVEAARREQEVKTNRQQGCTHHNPKGDHCFRAQVNSDGYFRPICLICQKEFPAIKATDEQRTGGIGLGNYKNLTEKALYGWAAATAAQAS